jgi:hypothetical protein
MLCVCMLKMGLLHGIDSYCVVSVDDMEDEVYQTRVCVYVCMCVCV